MTEKKPGMATITGLVIGFEKDTLVITGDMVHGIRAVNRTRRVKKGARNKKRKKR